MMQRFGIPVRSRNGDTRDAAMIEGLPLALSGNVGDFETRSWNCANQISNRKKAFPSSWWAIRSNLAAIIRRTVRGNNAIHRIQIGHFTTREHAMHAVLLSARYCFTNSVRPSVRLSVCLSVCPMSVLFLNKRTYRHTFRRTGRCIILDFWASVKFFRWISVITHVPFDLKRQNLAW